MAVPFGDDEIAAIRAATPGCRDELIHLNHAGSSLPAKVVLDAQIDHLRREAEIGGYEAADEAAERASAVYDSIATLIGAHRSEIARFEHATAAWNEVIAKAGQPGDDPAAVALRRRGKLALGAGRGKRR